MEFVIESEAGTKLVFRDDRQGTLCLTITDTAGDKVNVMILAKQDFRRLAKAL